MTLPNDPNDALHDLAVLARNDRTLRLPEAITGRFLERELRPRPYDRKALLADMATQTPTLFSDFPPPLADDIANADDPNQLLIQRLRDSTATDRYMTRFGIGSNNSVQHLTVREIMLRWSASQTVLGITDLPVRDRELNLVFDQNFLAFCNLMPISSGTVRRLEMLTAVISKAGKLTESHSDDLAVCNHCCIGKKLWFVWDTQAGLEIGLEDVERVDVRGNARFDIELFLSLEGAKWFFVGPGDTVFLPGMYTHRVYTLKDYVGVGSFYVTLPNVFHSAARWLLQGSIWEWKEGIDGRRLADDILATAIEKLRELEQGTAPCREAWGYEMLPAALRHMDSELGYDTMRLRKICPRFDELITEAANEFASASD